MPICGELVILFYFEQIIQKQSWDILLHRSEYGNQSKFHKVLLPYLF